MDRGEFLKRIGVAVGAVALTDPKALEAAFTEAVIEANPQVEIVRKGAVVASGTLDEILKTYYLPPVKEMLNAEPVLLFDGGKHNGSPMVRVPLDFGPDHELQQSRGMLPAPTPREFGEARVYFD